MDPAEALRSDKRLRDMDDSDPHPRVPGARNESDDRRSNISRAAPGSSRAWCSSKCCAQVKVARDSRWHRSISSSHRQGVYTRSADVVANGARDMIHTDEESVTNSDKVLVIFAPFA